MSARVLVTGAMGCLGAWTVKHLLELGHEPVAFDLSEDRRRLDLIVPQQALASVEFAQGDLTHAERLSSLVQEKAIDAIIHLAALQVPFCRANPALGVRVNVEGTTNVFEAAKNTGIGHVAFASSIAVYGSAGDYPPGLIGEQSDLNPRTFYGVTKVANEGMARIYYADHGISSTALRPYTVYGLGRDQGLTSEPTLAMAAAARGENASISFGGATQMHLASDVARQFIDAALEPLAGANVFNLGGPVVSVQEVARAIESVRPGARIEVGDQALPFPSGFDDSLLRSRVRKVYETPLDEGVRLTIENFERLG